MACSASTEKNTTTSAYESLVQFGELATSGSHYQANGRGPSGTQSDYRYLTPTPFGES